MDMHKIIIINSTISANKTQSGSQIKGSQLRENELVKIVLVQLLYVSRNFFDDRKLT